MWLRAGSGAEGAWLVDGSGAEGAWLRAGSVAAGRGLRSEAVRKGHGGGWNRPEVRRPGRGLGRKWGAWGRGLRLSPPPSVMAAVYDVLTGAAVRRLAHPGGCVRDVCWHPAGGRLVSASVRGGGTSGLGGGVVGGYTSGF